MTLFRSTSWVRIVREPLALENHSGAASAPWEGALNQTDYGVLAVEKFTYFIKTPLLIVYLRSEREVVGEKAIPQLGLYTTHEVDVSGYIGEPLDGLVVGEDTGPLA